MFDDFVFGTADGAAGAAASWTDAPSLETWAVCVFCAGIDGADVCAAAFFTGETLEIWGVWGCCNFCQRRPSSKAASRPVVWTLALGTCPPGADGSVCVSLVRVHG